MRKKILILKNDRTGDLFTSLNAINRIINKHKDDDKIIYLSEINEKFSFLFPSIQKKTISMNLNFFDKIKIIFYLLNNKIDIIYILSPKNFYFFLPIIFRKIKFYAVTIKSLKSRPHENLLKYLHKYVIIDRLNIKKRNSTYLIQESLIEYTSNNNNLSTHSLKSHNFNFPKKYIFFHYKHSLFKKSLNWSLDDISFFLNFLSSKFDNIMFSSELLDKKINNFFLQKYNSYDFITNKNQKINTLNIFFLKDINGYDLFDVVKNSAMIICPEGIISHMSYFLKKKLLTLMHFNLQNKNDIKEQIISCKEWFPPKNFKFCVLKKDLNLSIKKIEKRLNYL